jgi:uncharacterized protein (DUF1778 family)
VSRGVRGPVRFSERPDMAEKHKPVSKTVDRVPRPGGTHGRERPKADIDRALEEGAYSLEMVINRARAIQAGRDVAAHERIKDLDSVDFAKMVTALETLAKIQPAVDAAMDRMKGSKQLDGKSDQELYELFLEKTRGLGEKLGKGRLEET